MAHLVTGYVAFDQMVAQKEQEALRAEMSNTELRDLVVRLQDRLAQTTRDHDTLNARLATFAAQNNSLRGQLYTTEARVRALEELREQIASQRMELQQRLMAAEEMIAARSGQIESAQRSLEAIRSEQRMTETQRGGLVARVKQLEAELQSSAGRFNQLKTTAEATEKNQEKKTATLQAERDKALVDRDKIASDRDKAMADRDKAFVERDKAVAETQRVVAERERLKAQIAMLEKKLVIGSNAPAGATAVPPTASATPSPSDDDVDVAEATIPVRPGFEPSLERSKQGWTEVERLLASAGVDVKNMLTAFGGIPSGQGGPFVPADPRRGKQVAELPPETIQKMLKSLPLAAPLDDYKLESRFGGRVDPFNRRKSFHSGLDFSAAYRAPVFTTAPGTVVFAGAKGDYGRVVEIDHGAGIVTRYAHLHRMTVVVGQKLTGRQQIGELGSSGRSSGPHVHYEVMVNGTPQDPEKFLRAGRSVTQTAAVRK